MALAPSIVVAVRRAHHLRHHGREHLDRLRLCRRRDAAGAARRALRPARRRVRRGLRARPRARRLAGEIDPRLPFWIAGGPRPRERALRRCSAAGVAAARAARAVLVAARQPARRAQAAALASELFGLASVNFLGIWRMRCCRVSRALHGVPLRLGRAAVGFLWRASACARWCRAR